MTNDQFLRRLPADRTYQLASAPSSRSRHGCSDVAERRQPCVSRALCDAYFRADECRRQGSRAGNRGGFLLPLVLGLRVTRRKIFYKPYQLWIIWLAIGLVAGLSIYIAATDRYPDPSSVSLR